MVAETDDWVAMPIEAAFLMTKKYVLRRMMSPERTNTGNRTTATNDVARKNTPLTEFTDPDRIHDEFNNGDNIPQAAQNSSKQNTANLSGEDITFSEKHGRATSVLIY
jgi:hypothetical protein